MEPLSPGARKGQGFPPWVRLTNGKDIRAVFDNRCCYSEGWLAVHARVNGLAHSRFGSSIGKRLVGNNCRRNRVRRLLREAMRFNLAQIPGGFDFVLTSRRGGIPDLGELMASLPKLAKKAGDRALAREARRTNPDQSVP